MPGITARPICLFLLLLLTIFVCGNIGPAAAAESSYIVIDANSGRVLSARSPDEQLYPASMTKMMTLYLTFEALSQGRLSLRTPLQISELASEQAPSKLGLHPGQPVTVETCIYAAVTLSANDCAMALAENIGGSEDEFARLMTSRAHSLGMVRTHFNNPNGLPDDGQLTTARDMATLATALIQRFPKYYSYFATRSFTYRGITHLNHNHLMSRYPGMDGIKTGYIRASGFNLTASAVQGKHRLIAVVFGGQTAKLRDNFMSELLDDGFRRAANLPGGPQFVSPAVEAIGPPPEKPDEIPVGANEVDGVKLAEAGDAVESDEGAPATAQAIIAQPIAAAPVAEAAPKNSSSIAVPEEMLDAKLPPAITPTQTAQIAPPAKPAIAAPAPVPSAEDAIDEPPPTHTLHVPPAHHQVSAASKYNVAIGTYSSRSMSDQMLVKAVAALPHDMRNNVRPVSVALKLHNKRAYRAELTGLTQMDAKRVCSVLTHCTPIKS